MPNTAVTLDRLPSPPPGKKGWPWTEQTEVMAGDNCDLPRITIVTPSYNQGEFIEETIRSVLLQNYPNLEYLIIDGGSTDNTLKILKKYEPFVSWISERDRGQSDAVNKGFQRATGKLIGWQNSDDRYQPNAFWLAAKKLQIHPEADVIYGRVDFVDEESQFLYSYPIAPVTLENMIPHPSVCNQSAFFRDRVFQENQYLDESLKHCMDHEFFLRLLFAGYRFTFEPQIVGNFRLHSGAKTAQQAQVWSEESFNLYREIYENTALSQQLRDRARDCLQGICRQDFNQLRLQPFRNKLHRLTEISGWQVLNFEFIFKYALSWLGKEAIARLKNL